MSLILSCIFRQVKFQGAKTAGPKRVAEEVIIEVEDLAASAKQQKLDESAASTTKPMGNQSAIGTFKKPQTNRNGFSQKSSLANLIKRKTPTTATATATTATTVITETPDSTNSTVTASNTSTAAKPPTNTTNALSLLSGYDNYSDSDDSD